MLCIIKKNLQQYEGTAWEEFSDNTRACVCLWLTLQWQCPFVLLQLGSKPLSASQSHGPHVGDPHQPLGHWWSILHMWTDAATAEWVCKATQRESNSAIDVYLLIWDRRGGGEQKRTTENQSGTQKYKILICCCRQEKKKEKRHLGGWQWEHFHIYHRLICWVIDDKTHYHPISLRRGIQQLTSFHLTQRFSFRTFWSFYRIYSGVLTC